MLGLVLVFLFVCLLFDFSNDFPIVYGICSIDLSFKLTVTNDFLYGKTFLLHALMSRL